MVEIDEQHAELIAKSRRPVDFCFERLIQVPRVVESRAVVGDGQFLNLFHPARILNGDGGVIAKRLKKENLRLVELR